ncbi:hypothetical protein ACQEUU_29925 [Nonomuraea sp. CA-218870]|uniref:hypothetical protein n=1 Tax=Nonomuraea sp. CA-218870 TaxID=3239998 RepID=UPI003D8BF92B
MDQDARDLMVRLLRGIPSASESGVPAERLCRDAGVEKTVAVVLGPAFAGFLRAFGAITEDNGLVKAVSPASFFFLRSLAEYLDAGHPIFFNWSRPRTTEAPYSGQEVLAGPQFLYLMEQRRTAVNAAAAPLRSVRAAQVVIKTVVGGRDVRYLVHYDPVANQYQLPGGRRRHDDLTIQDVAIRELDEEIPKFDFTAGMDQLVELGVAQVTQVSRSTGVNTLYEITIFQLVTIRNSVPLAPGARWVSEKALLSPQAKVDGVTFNMTALRMVARSLPGGLSQLPSGFQEARPRRLLRIVRNRPWEAAGVILGILGIVVSVIEYLFT